MSNLPQTGERWRATCVVEGVVTTHDGYMTIKPEARRGWSFAYRELTAPDGWTFEKVTPPLPTTPGSVVRGPAGTHYLRTTHDPVWLAEGGARVDKPPSPVTVIFDAGAS